MTKLNKAFEDGDKEALITLLSQRPGVFARYLDYLIRAACMRLDENEDDIERLLPYSEENETESGNSCMVTLLIMCTALSSVAACLIILFHYL